MSTPIHCPTCTGPLDASGGCSICEHFARVRLARRHAVAKGKPRWPRGWRPIVPKAANGRPVAAQSALPPSDRTEQ